MSINTLLINKKLEVIYSLSHSKWQSWVDHGFLFTEDSYPRNGSVWLDHCPTKQTVFTAEICIYIDFLWISPRKTFPQ